MCGRCLKFKQAHFDILKVPLCEIKRVQMSSLIEHSRINNEILDCVSTYSLSMHHIDEK